MFAPSSDSVLYVYEQLGYIGQWETLIPSEPFANAHSNIDYIIMFHAVCNKWINK